MNLFKLSILFAAMVIVGMCKPTTNSDTLTTNTPLDSIILHLETIYRDNPDSLPNLASHFNKKGFIDEVQLSYFKTKQQAKKLQSSSPDSSLFYFEQSINNIPATIAPNIRIRLSAHTYAEIAYSHFMMGNYDDALKYDSISLNLATEIKDSSTLVKAINTKGLILFYSGEFDRAIQCYQQAFNMAERIGNLKQQAKISSNRAMIYHYQGDLERTEHSFLETLRIAKKLNDKGMVAGSYLNLSILYMHTNQTNKALSNYKKALDMQLEMGDQNGVMLCYQNIGSLYFSQSKYVDAIEYYNLSLKLARRMKDKVNIAKGYHNLAEVFSFMGDYQQAIEKYQKALKIYDETDNHLSIINSYISIANLHYRNDNYDMERPYLEKALTLSKKLNYKDAAARVYSSMGTLFSAQEQKDSAIVYFNRAGQIFETLNDQTGLSNAFLNIADEYLNQDELKKAEEYLQKAIMIKTELSELETLSSAYNQLALLYLQKAKTNRKVFLPKAVQAGEKAYSLALGINAIPPKRDACNVLRIIYKNQHSWAKAFKYSEEYNHLTDSISSKDKTEALLFAEARWQTEKKQQEINNLEQTQKLNQQIIKSKEEESRQQKTIIWTLIVLFVLLGVTIAVIFLYIRNRRDAAYQKQLRKITSLRLQNSRNTMSPHFFFNMLASLNDLVNQPEIIKSKINHLSILLRKVIENIDRTHVSLGTELEAVKSYISLQQDLIPGSFNAKYNVKASIDLDKSVPAMILQIPVENAIKHGLLPLEGNRQLQISIQEEDHKLVIEIEDNGIGLKASRGKSQGTGTGLKVLQQTIYLLNTKNKQQIVFSIKEKSQTDNTSGTLVSITLPIDFNYTL